MSGLRQILSLCVLAAGAQMAAVASAQGLPSLKEMLKGVGQQLAPGLDTSKTTARANDKRCDKLLELPDATDSAATLIAAISAATLQQRSNDVKAVLKDERIRNGAKNQLWIPADVETRLAKSAHAEMVGKQQVAEDDDLNEMDRRNLANVRTIFDGLVGQLPPDQPYKFEVFLTNEDEANARALPGGLVYLSKAAARSSKELLAILLAHEVAHVTKRHQSRWLQGRLVDSVTSVDQLIGLLRGNPDVINTVTRQAGGLSARFSRFSADQELEADACAVRLGAATRDLDVKLGVDGFLGLIEKEGGAKKKGRPPPSNEAKISFEAAHPSYEERSQTMYGLIAHWRNQAAVTQAKSAPPAAVPEPAATTTQKAESGVRGLLDNARKAIGR